MSTTSVGPKSAGVRLRLEPELKQEAGKILADAGLELSAAIRIFLKQVVAHRGLPFVVRQPSSTTMRAMKQARTIAKPRFGSAQELFDGVEKGRQRQGRNAAAKKRLYKRVSKGLGRAAG
jgi:DNA-damage-inducible protein J